MLTSTCAAARQTGIAFALITALLLGSGCGSPHTAQQPNSAASDASLVARCFGQGVAPNAVARVGDILFAGDVGPIVFPQAQLPDNTPLRPYKLTGDPSKGFPGSFVGNSYVDPMGPGTPFATNFSLLVCNSSLAKSHVLNAVNVRITRLIPHTGDLNAWQPLPCSTSYFSTASGVVTQGGCGGANVAQLYASADFADQAQVGTVAEARPTDGGATRVTISPGATLAVSIASRLPHHQGAYTFALGVSVDGAAVSYGPPSHPSLYAPITQEWDGVSCQNDAMRAQLPALGSNPVAYYLCPRP